MCGWTCNAWNPCNARPFTQASCGVTSHLPLFCWGRNTLCACERHRLPVGTPACHAVTRCRPMLGTHRGWWAQTKTRQAKVDYQEVHKKLRIITGSLAGEALSLPASTRLTLFLPDQGQPCAECVGSTVIPASLHSGPQAPAEVALPCTAERLWRRGVGAGASVGEHLDFRGDLILEVVHLYTVSSSF